MSLCNASTENTNNLTFSKKASLVSTIKEKNKKHLEEKNKKYGFDFASDNSPPNQIFDDPSLIKDFNENSKTPEDEEKSPFNNICFYHKKSLRKNLKEILKFSFEKNTEPCAA